MKLTMILLCAFLILMGWMGKPADGTNLPNCVEDDVIQGVGNYYEDGTWSDYECVHVERLAAGNNG